MEHPAHAIPRPASFRPCSFPIEAGTADGVYGHDGGELPSLLGQPGLSQAIDYSFQSGEHIGVIARRRRGELANGHRRGDGQTCLDPERASASPRDAPKRPQGLNARPAEYLLVSMDRRSQPAASSSLPRRNLAIPANVHHA